MFIYFSAHDTRMNTSRRKTTTSLMILAMKMTLYDTDDDDDDADDDNTIMTKSEFDGKHNGGTILLIINK